MECGAASSSFRLPAQRDFIVLAPQDFINEGGASVFQCAGRGHDRTLRRLFGVQPFPIITASQATISDRRQ
ncbi:hypothetical protein BCCGELA001_01365 [Bradyrhizobium sp. CCGE-LA001]|nr:hypothetical protein BCCGELA001_01365 [Bradyrhizobium sp. CCGE-LA001]